MNELSKITKKEILYKENYVSYTKSMLHLPIFTVSKNIDKTVSYEIKIDKYEGFKNIVLVFPPLSIKNDFMVFTYIIKKFYKNCDNELDNPFEIDFSLNDFFDYFEVSRTNRSSYSKTIFEVLKRLSRINLSFSREKKTYICNFLSSVVISEKGDRFYNLEIGKNFLNLFKHDENLIFNLNLDNYKLLNKEFSKILYIYYITNTHKVNKKNNVASFDLNSIYTRLQSSGANKRTLEHIRDAHNELINNKLIKSFTLSKTGQKITHINIEYFTKTIEEVKEEFKEDVKNETDITGFENSEIKDSQEEYFESSEKFELDENAKNDFEYDFGSGELNDDDWPF